MEDEKIKESKKKLTPGKNTPWNFKGMTPKHTTVIQARKELFRGGHGQYFGTSKHNAQAPKGLQEVHLYVQVGNSNVKKKAMPKGKSWEQQIVEF